MDRQTLQRVGIAVIAFGLLDVGVGVYCFLQRIPYGSNFNIFAVVAGVLLYRGSFRTARIIVCVVAFWLGAVLPVVFVTPFVFPPDLVWACLKFRPLASAVIGTWTILEISMLVWTYKQLARSVVAADSIGAASPGPFWLLGKRAGFLLGLALGVFVGLAVAFLLHGARADRAIAEAKRSADGSFVMHVTNLAWTTSDRRTSVWATVVAYDNEEMKSFQVSWQE